MKKSVLKHFGIFTEKHLCWSLFLIKLFVKKRLQNSCFPVNIAKNVCEQLLLGQPVITPLAPKHLHFFRKKHEAHDIEFEF